MASGQKSLGVSASPFNKTRPMSKADAMKTLTAADYAALPFLKKKCTDKNDPEFGMRQEDRLVKHILERMRLSDTERRMRVQRLQEIDVQLSGVVKMDKEERKRDRKNKIGRKPSPIPHNLPLAYAQIDDCVTYCMSLFAPEMNVFVATSTAEKQSVAEGLTDEIGRHGQTLQYYRQLAKLCLNALKYNFGALSIRWEEQTGIVFTADSGNTPNAQATSVTGSLSKVNGTVWEGNVLKCCDTYNFFFDTSVHPVDLPLRGEYFAEVEMQTPFRVKRQAQQKILFGVQRYINTFSPASGTTDGVAFYIQPPMVRELNTTAAEYKGVTNWVSVLTPGGPARESQPGIELCWFTTWINPKDFDLSQEDELQCWQICMANGRWITSAFHIDDSHGQLPIAISTPIEDDLRNDQRTYAEMLLPLQHFASFLLNTHVDASRKAIYGITVFDSSLFPGIDLSTEDLIGARIPMKSSSTGVDIDKAFRHYNAAPQTDQNVEMVGKIVELMQKILPTNQAQQVADLERATEYQAAATVQASSRRNLKIARLINDQCLSVAKFQMLYNIYENVSIINYTDAQGQPNKITPKDLLDARIEFDVGTGLKGLDRLQQVSIFKDLMGYLFQVKDIGQQVDLLALLSYVTQIAGFDTDLSSFKIQPPVIPPGTGNAPSVPGQETAQQPSNQQQQ